MEQKQEICHEKEETASFSSRQPEGAAEDVLKKPRPAHLAEGRAAPQGVTRKGHPLRWSKRNFTVRVKRPRLSKAKKPRSTHASLPKFLQQQQQQQQQQTKKMSGGTKDAAAVHEVRRHITTKVLAEQGLVDAAVRGYDSFLSEVTAKGVLFSHQFENELGRHVFTLEDVEPRSVQDSPLLCRQEERSYILPLTVRATYSCVDTRGSLVRSFSHRVFLGEIPLMVGCRLCRTRGATNQEMVAMGQQPGEPGGYFIVDGIEKFIPFRNVNKKNNLMVLRCLGQEGQKFSFRCSVFSSVSKTESFQTVVLASTKHSLVVKLSLGRGVNMMLPLSKVLAATGVLPQPEPQQETESFIYLRRTLSAILPLKEQQQQQKGAGDIINTTLTRDAFKGQDGGKSVVAEAILDYLAAAALVHGVTEQELQQVHSKCARSEAHHCALLKIASKFVEMCQEETQQKQKHRRWLAALRDVMLQGCEDVPDAALMVTDALTLPSEKEALKDIRKATRGLWKEATTSELLGRVLVPHAGGSLAQRACYLAFMVNQLLMVVCGRRPADDSLHLGNRMLLTPGTLVRNLFDSVMRPILQRAKDAIDQNYRNPRPILPEELDHGDCYEGDEAVRGDERALLLKKDEKVLSEKFDIFNIFQFHHNILCEKMCAAFKNGRWGEGPSAMKGVTQNLERLNYMQYLSQLRTVSGEDKVLSGKGSLPHQLHTSTVGFFCLMETPENENVGLTEHLALGATVCSPPDPTHVQHILQALPVRLFAADDFPAADRLGKVFVNGRWVGNAEGPLQQIKESLLEYRRRHALHLGVHLRNHDLHIDHSGGRLVRPLLVVQGGALTLTDSDLPALREGCFLLDDLWRKGIIDFVDPLENSEAFIAETEADLHKEAVDYCQLQALLSHGIVSAAIPVGSTNPGVRRLGSCKMQKQAMGQPVVSELLTHHGTYSVLKTPEMPLAMPHFILQLPNARHMYSGQSALTAVMAVRGLNQEDGLVFSQGAIDRGLLTSLHFHAYRKCEPFLGAEVTACAEVGRLLHTGEVVISCKDKRQHVLVQEVDAPSQVTRSRVRYLPDGRVLYEVETLQERRPEVGDKFSTLNGQKGVICGILPDHKLPRLEDGRTPDIFISPHSFLDRQTVGFFVEGMLNTLAAHMGFLLDATSIDSGWSLSRAQEALRMQRLSAAVKVLSASGREMGRIFCAPIFYMRLKHLAALKCHARHDGPLDPLFRQPTESLSHGGGLRLGEMEVAALVSHGAAELVQELMHDQSDGLQLPYCNTCDRWAEMVGEYVSCRLCRRIDNLVLRRTTYAFKFFEECLMMMNLKLLQHGQGHQCSERDVEYDSDVSSLSSEEECEAEPRERVQDAMKTIIRRCWRDSLRLGEWGAARVQSSNESEAASSSISVKDNKPPKVSITETAPCRHTHCVTLKKQWS